MYNHEDNILNGLPFHSIVDYDVETNFESSKRRIQRLMEDHRILNFIKQYNLNRDLEFDDLQQCSYHDEESFNKLSISSKSINIFSLNIRSLPGHGGQLLNFLNLLDCRFDILILTEIGSRNISVVETLLPGYAFHHVTPINNMYGGIGIYVSNDVENFSVLHDLSLTKDCNCVKCNFESLCIDFSLYGNNFTVLGVYNHPGGNLSHFGSALHYVMDKIDDKRTLIVAGDINIDLLRYNEPKIQDYLTLMLSENLLPYICLPTRITSHSATCIDHIFVRTSKLMKNTKFNSGILYSDISDHLPCFLSIEFKNEISSSKKRPKVRLFGERNCLNFKTSISNLSWDDLYTDSDDWYSIFIKKS